MAVVDVALIRGPMVQKSGRCRGEAEVEMDDRTRRYQINTKNIVDWTTATLPTGLAAIGDIVQAREAKIDAEKDADKDGPVTPRGQASVWERAVAKVRRAMGIRKPLRAWALLDRVFTELRSNQSLNQNQVENRLKNNGLSDEEYTDAFARWTELDKNVNQNRMANYELVLDADIWGQRVGEDN